MGLSLITDDEKGTIIYRKDKVSTSGNAYSTFCTKVSSKDKDGNWSSAFINVAFRKADVDKITNKCKIAIKESFPTLNTYNGNTNINWMIMSFDVLEEGEAPNTENSGSLDDSFVDVDTDSEELPFA